MWRLAAPTAPPLLGLMRMPTSWLCLFDLGLVDRPPGRAQNPSRHRELKGQQVPRGPFAQTTTGITRRLPASSEDTCTRS